jgi:hypothetical protein
VSAGVTLRSDPAGWCFDHCSFRWGWVVANRSWWVSLKSWPNTLVTFYVPQSRSGFHAQSSAMRGARKVSRDRQGSRESFGSRSRSDDRGRRDGSRDDHDGRDGSRASGGGSRREREVSGAVVGASPRRQARAGGVANDRRSDGGDGGGASRGGFGRSVSSTDRAGGVGRSMFTTASGQQWGWRRWNFAIVDRSCKRRRREILRREDLSR